MYIYVDLEKLYKNLPMFHAGHYIKSESVGIFWRKLDLKPTTNLQENDISSDEEIEMLKKHVNKLSKFGKTSLLRKIMTFIEALTTSVAEPAVQNNTRGRPNLKSKLAKSNHVDASFVVTPSQDPLTRSYSNMSNLDGVDRLNMNMNQEDIVHT